VGYADELFDLTDRVVLVTGGSRALGRAGQPSEIVRLGRAHRR
jgi:hypothetical protein